MNTRTIYLDHAATTPLDSRVLDAMMPFLTEHHANPSSAHGPGRRARFAVESAREEVARLLGAEPAEIVFTSGGTESDNAALVGVVRASKLPLVTSRTEHEAILKTAEDLRSSGIDVTMLDPGSDGAVDPAAVERAIESRPALVSIMHANNELGTLSQIREIAEVCHRHDSILHSDAVQSAGLYDLDMNELGVDLLSISAHKFYGPKGVGALYVRSGTPFEAFVHGGAQERGRRGGTENVAAIVGLARALRIASDEAVARRAHLERLRDALNRKLESALGDAIVFNSPISRGAGVAHVVNVSFPPRDGRPIDGEMLLLNMDIEGVCVSAGSACTSGAIEPSHVLLAMGRDRETASATIRFSMGKDTTSEEIDRAVDALRRVYRRMIR